MEAEEAMCTHSAGCPKGVGNLCSLTLEFSLPEFSSTRATVGHAPALFDYLFHTLYLQETIFMAENAVAKPTIHQR